MIEPRRWSFGPFVFDARSRELISGRGAIRLQQQPAVILAALLHGEGNVVSRDDLRLLLWPRGTFVDYEHSLNAAVKRLRAALGDDLSSPPVVETVPRVGYRLAPSVAEAMNGGRRRLPRIALLPFSVLGAQADIGRFCEGLSEELAATLGQKGSGRLTVVARSSAASLTGGPALRARDIGSRLGASYLIEGAARGDDSNLRLTMRLIESDAEAQVWSGAYDVPPDAGIRGQAVMAAEMVDAVLRCV